MNGRRLATPGALLIFAGSFLLYWGLKELGIIGDGASNVANATQSVSQPSSSSAIRSA